MRGLQAPAQSPCATVMMTFPFLRPEMFGQLHRSGADTARSTVDEHLFPALKFCPPEKIQRCLAAKRQRGGFVVRQTGRLKRDRAIF